MEDGDDGMIRRRRGRRRRREGEGGGGGRAGEGGEGGENALSQTYLPKGMPSSKASTAFDYELERGRLQNLVKTMVFVVFPNQTSRKGTLDVGRGGQWRRLSSRE